MFPSKVYHIKNTDVKGDQPVIDGKDFQSIGYNWFRYTFYATLNDIQFPDRTPDRTPDDGRYILEVGTARLNIMIFQGRILPLTNETWPCFESKRSITVSLFKSNEHNKGETITVSWIATITIFPKPIDKMRSSNFTSELIGID